MSRRPPASPLANVDRARGRMAPGGRMWSESPVIPVRRRVGQAGLPVLADPPTGVTITRQSGNLLVDVEDATSAVALAYATGYDDLDAPAGWEVLADGFVFEVAIPGSPIAWALLALNDATDTHDLTFDWLTPLGPDGLVHRVTGVYQLSFLGGSPGTWSVAVGATYEEEARAALTAPPSGQVFAQFGALSSVWTGESSGLPAGFSLGPSAAVSDYGPTAGTYTGDDFDMFTGTPATGSITWTSLGALGSPNSQSLAIAWNP